MRQIRELIVQNRLRDALKALAAAAPSHLQNDVTLLQSRFNKHERDKNSGILYPSEAGVEWNRIVNAALDLCTLMENNGPSVGPTTQKSSPQPPTGNQPKTVFFSYSKHDRPYLEELLRHLSPLVRQGKLQPWNDHDILPGDEWDDEVREKLNAADIYLFLVSAYSISTDYILDVEIPVAMARHESRKARVIPIVLKSCDWEGLPFGKLNGLPSKGKPVSAYTDRDEAWVAVVNGIKRVVE